MDDYWDDFFNDVFVGEMVNVALRDVELNTETLPHILAWDVETIADWFNTFILQHRPRRLRTSLVPTWRDALQSFYDSGTPQTVRQVFYRCTTYGRIPKTENGYQKVGGILRRMREYGILPYDWIADNTRWMRKPTTYSSLESMLENMQKTYRRDLWAQQDDYVEIWLEKDALAGVLYDVTNEFDVPLMVTRGYSSTTFAHNAALEINRQVIIGKRVTIYHLGDHDPSGVDARNDIGRKLKQFTNDFVFIPLGVNLSQIYQWDLPIRPTKKKDPRSKNWNPAWPSVELDAIPADTLRHMCREAIEQHIDSTALGKSQQVEVAERETLAMVLESLNGAGNT